MAIASSVDMAERLVERSPISYAFITEKFDTMQPWSSSQVTSSIQPVETTNHDKDNESTGRETSHLSHKTFVLHAFPNDNYRHRSVMRLGPLYGPWPYKTDQDRTFVHFALREAVPQILGHKGLCDWTTGGQDSEDARLVRSPDEQEISVESHIADRRNRRRSKTPSTVADLMGASRSQSHVTSQDNTSVDSSQQHTVSKSQDDSTENTNEDSFWSRWVWSTNSDKEKP